jgi:tyrosyl-tRNA synthetase
MIAELRWRGLVHQTTDDAGLAAWLSGGHRTLYAGFDPTSDSLHVGSLLPLVLLRRFQKSGHRPIALVGGATGMIGDPSGKSEERNLLSAESLERNVAGIEAQIRALLDFDCGGTSALLVNNYDWMRGFGYLDFLRDVGKHFPVGAMMAKDSVRARLEREDGGLSYTEFSYMLLQAYDFVYLLDRFDCELQVGGSDQWGNITAGIELARRLRGASLFGLTCPLLTKSDGSKMGKTEQGAVWLSAGRFSPYHFYQYWINVDDADAGRCLRMLTDLPRDEIEALDRSREEYASRRESQTRLAEELTRLIHGDAGLLAARRATDVFFGGAEFGDMDRRQLTDIFADVPSREILHHRLAGDGVPLEEALVEVGLCRTKAEARRKTEQGGVYVNNHRVTDIHYRLQTRDLACPDMLVLRLGRKQYALIKAV